MRSCNHFRSGSESTASPSVRKTPKPLPRAMKSTAGSLWPSPQVGKAPVGRDLREAATDALRRAFQPSPEQEAVNS